MSQQSKDLTVRVFLRNESKEELTRTLRETTRLTKEFEAASREGDKVRAARAKVFNDLASGLTGGLVGAGAISSIMSIAAVVSRMMEDAGRLMIEAKRLGVGAPALARERALASMSGNAGLADQSIVAARRARAEAMAGDPDYVKAFKDLGLELGGLGQLRPMDLRQTVMDAFRRSSKQGEQREALRAILGQEAGDAFESYIAGGFMGGGFIRSTFNEFLSKVLTSPKLMASIDRGLKIHGLDVGKGVLAVMERMVDTQRVEFEPLAQFGQGNEKRLARMREVNIQAAAELSRRMLPVEEQITAAVAERLRLQRLIAETVDPANREKLRGDLLQVNAQILALAQSDPATVKGVGGAAAMAWPKSSDPLRNLGFDLGRIWGAGGAANYQKETVNALNKHETILADIRGELRQFNQ